MRRREFITLLGGRRRRGRSRRVPNTKNCFASAISMPARVQTRPCRACAVSFF